MSVCVCVFMCVCVYRHRNLCVREYSCSSYVVNTYYTNHTHHTTHITHMKTHTHKHIHTPQQVEYVFSDKTGTLTANEMQLRMISVQARVCGRLDWRYV